MLTYPHPRPTEPVQLYLLSALSGFGLIALWLAAFHAFLKVASGPQAFFAATLIEAGLIIEALALIKRPKVWYTWMAVAISLVVSGTYNYIQAAAAVTGPEGALTMHPWQVLTLALGPLAALVFVSLTLGHELREHQNRVEKWQTDRAAWLEERRLEAEAYEREQKAELQARLEKIQQAERERQEREAERRYQAEQSEREWQHKQHELAQRRLEREKRLSDDDPREVQRGQPAMSQTELAHTSSPSAPEPAEPSQSQLACDRCPRTFGTQAALNAHRRFCPGSDVAQAPLELISANGKR